MTVDAVVMRTLVEGVYKEGTLLILMSDGGPGGA